MPKVRRRCCVCADEEQPRRVFETSPKGSWRQISVSSDIRDCEYSHENCLPGARSVSPDANQASSRTRLPRLHGILWWTICGPRIGSHRHSLRQAEKIPDLPRYATTSLRFLYSEAHSPRGI